MEYDVIEAQKSFNEAQRDLDIKEQDLKAQRKVLGASIHTLEETPLTGTYAKQNMERILTEKRAEVREVELELDMTRVSRDSLTIDSFLGEGDNKPVDYSKLKRSTMSEEEKGELMKKLSLEQYMKIPFH